MGRKKTRDENGNPIKDQLERLRERMWCHTVRVAAKRAFGKDSPFWLSRQAVRISMLREGLSIPENEAEIPRRIIFDRIEKGTWASVNKIVNLIADKRFLPETKRIWTSPLWELLQNPPFDFLRILEIVEQCLQLTHLHRGSEMLVEVEVLEHHRRLREAGKPPRGMRRPNDLPPEAMRIWNNARANAGFCMAYLKSALLRSERSVDRLALLNALWREAFLSGQDQFAYLLRRAYEREVNEFSRKGGWPADLKRDIPDLLISRGFHLAKVTDKVREKYGGDPADAIYRRILAVTPNLRANMKQADELDVLRAIVEGVRNDSSL